MSAVHTMQHYELTDVVSSVSSAANAEYFFGWNVVWLLALVTGMLIGYPLLAASALASWAVAGFVRKPSYELTDAHLQLLAAIRFNALPQSEPLSAALRNDGVVTLKQLLDAARQYEADRVRKLRVSQEGAKAFLTNEVL